MSYLYQSVKGYIFKTPPPEPEKEEEKKEKDESETDEEVTEENSLGHSDKKTDEVKEEIPQANIVWRMSSGVYNTATGAVGMGVGGVKWVAGKSYDVGSTVVSNVKVPKLSSFKRKDKKE
ncbi:transmembrane protein 263-like [Mytilus galloprovincialis]|uniref:Uncharacterized protein n=1 Tax=Mytilus galloprovincialis TaxID=29158 RepID=A0A8B6F5E4_MYTGA|nr:Hypothetical predicted protein [Mytilus galloprovincialis]